MYKVEAVAWGGVPIHHVRARSIAEGFAMLEEDLRNEYPEFYGRWVESGKRVIASQEKEKGDAKNKVRQ